MHVEYSAYVEFSATNVHRDAPVLDIHAKPAEVVMFGSSTVSMMSSTDSPTCAYRGNSRSAGRWPRTACQLNLIIPESPCRVMLHKLQGCVRTPGAAGLMMHVPHLLPLSKRNGGPPYLDIRLDDLACAKA